MARTTIEIDEHLRDQLREERKAHESSYGDTIARLLNNDTGGQLWTEREIEDIARRTVESALEGRR